MLKAQVEVILRSLRRRLQQRGVFQQVAKFFDVLSAQRGVDDTMILAHPDLERWPTTVESQSSIIDFLRMVGASVAHFARRAYGTTVRVRSLPEPPS